MSTKVKYPVKIICAHCGKESVKEKGHVNRANKQGLKLYCDKNCSNMGRRINKTQAQKKEQKRLYDIEYRRKNKDRIKAQSQKYNESLAGRAMQKRNREKFKQSHLEYCRTPEYRAWKKEYDKEYRAKKEYGELWESAIVLVDIENNIPNREAVTSNGLNNKSQKRKREWKTLQQKI